MPVCAVASLSSYAPSSTTSSPAASPLPVEPEHVQETITSVRQELWWTWDSDGSAWLLPAFTFLDADGGRYTVPAVTDEYLIVEYALVDPAIDEPAPLPPDVVYDDTAISEADAAALTRASS